MSTEGRKIVTGILSRSGASSALDIKGDDFAAFAFDDELDGVAADGAVFDHGIGAFRGVEGARKNFTAERALDFDIDWIIHTLDKLLRLACFR
jgi:hypothetical protein